MSPRAYNYVRTKFNNNLPHTGTIRIWYANSSANGHPGISKETLETLTTLSDEHKAKDSSVYATLSLDEVYIKRHVQWSDAQKMFIGNITYGSIPQNAEYLLVANNAIVFMVNGINVSFNIPVAHHFINCLQSHERAALMSLVLRKVAETGVKIVVILFDGLRQNITACCLLGATFDVENDFKPYILNPFDNEKVFIMLDVPHMIKLIRNCIGMKKTLYDSTGNLIQWKFFELLEELRSKYAIATHKITKKHIMFEKNIMNVSLATELLSESAAKSMRKYANLPATKHLFEGSEPTAEFSIKCNNVFDIFNSKHECEQNIFKSPINEHSKEENFTYLDNFVEYIKGLSIHSQDKSILYSQRKTAFLGFIINIANVKEIYNSYVETKCIPNLRTRDLNQDPLENFFGRIRTTCLGNNDNPTVEQFCAAYRKILVCTELTTPSFANCKDSLNILQISSRSNANKNTVKPLILRVETTNDDVEKTNDQAVQFIRDTLIPRPINENSIDSFYGSELTLSYLAGQIESKFVRQTRTNCSECAVIMKNIFEENLKSPNLHVGCAKSQTPCESTIDICRIANKNLANHAFKIDFDYNELKRDIEGDLFGIHFYPETDFSHNLQHKIDLIDFIADEIIRNRANQIAKNLTLNEHKKLVRRQNVKATHFAGE